VPTITISRTGLIEKPKGLGEGRISEGTISIAYGSLATYQRVRAGSLGLRSLTSLHLTPDITGIPGSPEITPRAKVTSPGSLNNYADIYANATQTGSANILAAVTYITFGTPFAGSPNVQITRGSPTTTPAAGSASYLFIRRIRKGSASARGTPSGYAYYKAQGPAPKVKFNYIAVGD